jgi:hypothetical protein
VRTTLRPVRAALVLIFVVLPSALTIWHRIDPQALAQLTGGSLRPTPTQSVGHRLAFPEWSAPNNPNYAFLQTQPNSTSPVTWDPCRPIHYVVRPYGSPQGGLDLIQTAISNVSKATGLKFEYDGTTNESPEEQRPNYLPDQYGNRWAPVLVAWSSPNEMPMLSGDVIGLTSAQPVDSQDGRYALVSGQVALDFSQLTPVMQFNGGRAVVEATISHEFGHLVGLDHVGDPTQLMYPSARPVVHSFGAGDLTGLAQLGSGHCFPQL